MATLASATPAAQAVRSRRAYVAVRDDPERYAALLVRQRESDQRRKIAHPDEHRAQQKASNERFRGRLRDRLRDDPERYEEYRRDRNERARAQYKRNPDARRAMNARRIAEAHARLSALKVSRGCIDCGYNAAPEALHFDHVDPAQKSFGVSTMKTASAARLAAEIAKCEIRCANCHAIRTTKQQRIRHGHEA